MDTVEMPEPQRTQARTGAGRQWVAVAGALLCRYFWLYLIGEGRLDFSTGELAQGEEGNRAGQPQPEVAEKSEYTPGRRARTKLPTPVQIRGKLGEFGFLSWWRAFQGRKMN
jgi:hypothetical protein